MKSTRVIEVKADTHLRRFIQFPMDLYRDCPFYVPSLLSDEYGTLKPGSPAQDGCDSQLFLAVQNGNVLGRIAAIVNPMANKVLGTQNVRFGWFDSVKDPAVAEMLFEKAADWGRERGMKTMSGPLGYGSFDKAGMLTEGFEHIPTIATLYNYPYYVDLTERCGFEKEMDMVEGQIHDLHNIPHRIVRFAELLRRKSKYRLLKIKSLKKLLRRKDEVMDLIEDVFCELYDAFPMTPKQRDFCASKFLPYVTPNLTKIVVNPDDELIAFFVAMPSLSRAFQKAKGRLFPFGFAHIWRAMRRERTLDFCIGGVKKKYRRLGIDALMGVDLFKSAAGMGFTMAETNPELETNTAVRREWRDMNYVLHKRRRVYIKHI